MYLGRFCSPLTVPDTLGLLLPRHRQIGLHSPAGNPRDPALHRGACPAQSAFSLFPTMTSSRRFIVLILISSTALPPFRGTTPNGATWDRTDRVWQSRAKLEIASSRYRRIDSQCNRGTENIGNTLAHRLAPSRNEPPQVRSWRWHQKFRISGAAVPSTALPHTSRRRHSLARCPRSM